MAQQIKVLQCPHCERRSRSTLVDDLQHPFTEDWYECEHCGKIIKVSSQTGDILALGAIATGIGIAILSESQKKKNR